MGAARVSKDYVTVHTDPIRAQTGDVVRVGQRDNQWPGWIWCTNSDGKSAWVHESFLSVSGEQGVLTEDYDAAELTVKAGDVLRVLRAVGGWLWCETDHGACGWIPAENAELF